MGMAEKAAHCYLRAELLPQPKRQEEPVSSPHKLSQYVKLAGSRFGPPMGGKLKAAPYGCGLEFGHFSSADAVRSCLRPGSHDFSLDISLVL